MKILKALKKAAVAFYLGLVCLIQGLMQKSKQLRNNGTAEGSVLGVIIMLVAIMMAIIIGAIVFFAFADNIVGTSANANITKEKVVTYAIIVFGMLAIVPMIIVGGVMLRSLGFMGGGGKGV
jgi:hypothetical protein